MPPPRSTGHAPQGATLGGIPTHTGSVRPQPATFERADGQWRATYFGDPDAWEVICPGCGDDLGPAVAQADRVQVLRGPYRSEDAAHQAAAAHERLMDAAGRSASSMQTPTRSSNGP